MQAKISEAVGLAHKPGRNTIRRDMQRFFSRVFIRVLHNRKVPFGTRERVLFRLLKFSEWVFDGGLCPIGGGSKSNTYENDLLKLLFNATTIANVAINATSSPITDIAVALHTADPGETGDQTTSEAGYTNYARVNVVRTSSGWTVTNNSVSPVANIDFPAGGGGSGTVTHFSVGKTGGGATEIFYSGTVTPNIVTGNGVTPRLTTATAITED